MSGPVPPRGRVQPTDVQLADVQPTGVLSAGVLPAGPDRPAITRLEERNAMLLHEILSRTRMREDQHRARQERLASRLVTARRWQRLARYAELRARRARARL